MQSEIGEIVLGLENGLEGGALMSLFWVVIRELADIEAMVNWLLDFQSLIMAFVLVFLVKFG